MYEFLYDRQLGTSDPDPEPRQHYEVHCGRCHWWGMINQMKAIYKPNPKKIGDIVPELGCPMCLSDQWLEYKED